MTSQENKQMLFLVFTAREQRCTAKDVLSSELSQPMQHNILFTRVAAGHCLGCFRPCHPHRSTQFNTKCSVDEVPEVMWGWGTEKTTAFELVSCATEQALDAVSHSLHPAPPPLFTGEGASLC